jgi:hypothetical protein
MPTTSSSILKNAGQHDFITPRGKLDVAAPTPTGITHGFYCAISLISGFQLFPRAAKGFDT